MSDNDQPNVVFRTPSERYQVADWPKGWPVPRIGDSVLSEGGRELIVRHVIWYPSGEDGAEGDLAQPFVYVVLWDR